MKYIKKAPIVRNDPMSNRFSVLENDRIVTTTKVAMEMPRGGDADRPSIYVNGQIRWNIDLNEFEVYNGNSPGLGWELMRTVRPAPIRLQNLGNGDYVKLQFGPLLWGPGQNYADFTRPQNIFVFIENVFQIATVNYDLVQNVDEVFVVFTEPPPSKPVRVLLGYDGYFPPFPTP